MFQKLYHHLEQINTNTKQQHADLEHAEAWAEKISNQLETLNATIKTIPKQPKARPMQTAGLIVAGLGLIVLGMLSAYTFRLSAITDATVQRSAASLQAFGIVNGRYQTLAGSTLVLQAKTLALDTIVKQQAQAIVELKRLNAAAIRTIYYLQQDVNQYKLDREQARNK